MRIKRTILKVRSPISNRL